MTLRPRPLLLSVLVTTSMEATLVCAVFEYMCKAVKEVALNKSDPQKRILKGWSLSFWVEARRIEVDIVLLRAHDLVRQCAGAFNSCRFIRPDHVHGENQRLSTKIDYQKGEYSRRKLPSYQVPRSAGDYHVSSMLMLMLLSWFCQRSDFSPYPNKDISNL